MATLVQWRLDSVQSLLSHELRKFKKLGDPLDEIMTIFEYTEFQSQSNLVWKLFCVILVSVNIDLGLIYNLIVSLRVITGSLLLVLCYEKVM